MKSQISGGNRSLNRGVVVKKKRQHSLILSWTTQFCSLQPEPLHTLPFPSHPNIHHDSVPTVLALTFWKQIISSLASPFCLTSGKTMNHCDKLLTSEIPSRNIVTNRNSAITSFIALDIVSASSINQTIQDTIRQPLKLLCTLQMCHYMHYLRRTVTNFNIGLLILDDILIFFPVSSSWLFLSGENHRKSLRCIFSRGASSNSTEQCKKNPTYHQ